MSYIYIASPYSHELAHVREARFNEVVRYAAHCVKAGLIVYSPIAHWHPVAKAHGLPRDWAFWKRLDTAMIASSNGLHVLMLPGWNDSVGIRAEIGIAHTLEKAVHYIEAPQDIHVAEYIRRQA